MSSVGKKKGTLMGVFFYAKKLQYIDEYPRIS
ncbi:hypothetical protein SAN_2291 [Streptococcus agalactiae COH1]|nr:hypothetical protein SAN_2291 [Streptococcus agalactiae COH1]